MTKARKIIFSVILVIVLIPVVLAVAVQIPSAQTVIARKAADSFSERLNGSISLEKLYYSLPNSLIVKGLSAVDAKGDTALYAEKLLVNVSVSSLLSEHLSARKVAVENADIQLSRLVSVFPEKAAPATGQDTVQTTSGFLSYGLSRLLLKNVHIKAGNLSVDQRPKPYAINYGNADLMISELDARNIAYEDALTLELQNLALSEACGLEVDTFRGDITLDSEGLTIDGFRYSDADSFLEADSFKLLFGDFSCFSDFCNSVAFDADFLPSRLDFRSLQHYAGLSKKFGLVLNFDGHVTGPVSSLRSDAFHVSSGTGKTELELRFHLSGLPKARETMAGITLTECNTYMSDIARIINEVNGGSFRESTLNKFAPGERLSFKGSLDGLLTDFVAYGKLSTASMGEIDVDLLLSPEKEKGYLVDGFVNTEDFNLGAFLVTDAVGHLGCEAALSALLGRQSSYFLDTLYVSSVELLGQTYNGISAKGDYSSGFINAALDSRDEKLSFGATALLDTDDTGSVSANVSVSDLLVRQDGEIFDIGDITLEGMTSVAGSELTLGSEPAGLELNSDLSLAGIIEKAKNRDFSGGRTEAAIQIRDFSKVSGLLHSDLYICDGTSLAIELNPDGTGDGFVKSELVAVGDNYFKGILANLVLRDSALNVIVSADTLQSGDIVGRGTNLDADLILDDSLKMLAKLNDSSVEIEGTQWHLSSQHIGYNPLHLEIGDFRLESEGNCLALDGVLSDSVDDTLSIVIDGFDLALANAFAGEALDLKGALSGSGSIFGLFGESKGILLDLVAEDMGIGESELGDFNIRSDWDDSLEVFNVFVDNSLDGGNPLNVSGSFKPQGRTLDMGATIDGFDLSVLEPFLASVVTDVSGSLSGNLSVSGPLESLSISSEACKLDNLACRLLYTQVPYTIDGPFSVDEYGVDLGKLKIRDRFGHEGRISGGVQYDHFKNLSLNTRIRLNNMQGLATNASQGDSFYGNAFASGEVRLGNGPQGLTLDMNIVTEPNSTIHIPLSSSGKEQTSILTFIGNELEIPSNSAYDSLRMLHIAAKEESSSSSAITVNMNIEATPDAEIQLEVNKTTGDVLKTRGNGQIVIKAGGVDEVFDIRGGYTVNEGSYKLSMIGITSRDFTINPGGTISFTGDIMQSDLDMTATYRTKASIGTLIADTTSVSTRRNVDCGIGIGGKLANPEVAFSIDVPDLDPATKGKVESALNSEDKRMKQFLAVLVSGSFVPDEESGIVNNTSVLYSNVSEIMANQLNNIFRQLEIPLDLGFNYQPTGSGKDIFDVAISTQLFNNRVLINGNFGNRQYMSSSQGDLVGDVDIEVKLNQTGQLRLNLFSHSADEYSNYLDQTQRNGAGIVYQEEFDTFRELWRKLFRPGRRRPELMEEQEGEE